jgi:hypothetical protein
MKHDLKGVFKSLSKSKLFLESKYVKGLISKALTFSVNRGKTQLS